MKVGNTNTLKLPFLGTLEDGEPFQYLLLSMETKFAEIALLKWFLNRVQLHKGDTINLHLPYLLSTEYKLLGNISGTVIAAEHSEEGQGEIYRISLSEQIKDPEIQYDSLNQLTKQLQAKGSLTDLFIHLLKDSMILKAGIKVYFKHLIPYFSRISDYSYKKYELLKINFLYDIEKHITSNEAKLEEIYQNTKNKINKLEEIAIFIDLELLREILESEISSSVFNIIFSNENVPKLSLDKFPQTGVYMYINAIKNLEKRLYSNYNHIVIIYLESIKRFNNHV